MKRKLLTQILTEWRSNIWIAIELFIVSVILWYLVDNLYVKASIYRQPLGFDISHTYRINYSDITSTSPEYIPDRDHAEDLSALIEMLQNRPEVEVVAASINSYPYNPSNSGSTPTFDSISSKPGAYIVSRAVSPEFPLVFRWHGEHGESPEVLQRLLRDNPNSFLASADLLDYAADKGVPPISEFIGQRFNNINFIGDSVPLVGTYSPVRYDDLSSNESMQSILVPLPYIDWANEISLRVYENMDSPDFIDNIMHDASRTLKSGNIRISSVTSFADIKDTHMKPRLEKTRSQVFIILFLSLNIFLGVLGTFWFRTRRRTREIALRMTCGASSAAIFRRIISEGQLILLIVTIPAIFVDWLLTRWELNAYSYGHFVPDRFIGSVLIAWGCMALMILIGVSIPAWRAMHVAPAIALKDD